MPAVKEHKPNRIAGETIGDLSQGSREWGYIIPFPGVRYYLFTEEEAESQPQASVEVMEPILTPIEGTRLEPR